MENNIVELAVSSVQKSKVSFCKFISANDAGSTGAHQSGYYIPKNSVELLFSEPGTKGSNKDRFVTISWQNDFKTTSRFIYYGTGTRNEYRVTRFGKNFPFLNENNVGNLLILSQIEGDEYEGYVLDNDTDFETFFASVNINASETNKIIPKTNLISVEESLLMCFQAFINTLDNKFPATFLMAENARNCFNSAYGVTLDAIINNPDKHLLYWLETEFELFKTLENNVYADQIGQLFSSVEELVVFANTVLNRRKSRAGKSLEYHLEDIFGTSGLKFNTQVITEGNKKPDFIFPDIESYHTPEFDESKLIFLASKTTCKDRWRQVINEADRIHTKHLFTLQQGISKNQLDEMYSHGVCLVVPKPYIITFPQEYRDRIWSLSYFIDFAINTQS
jgi:hypothetical protein